MFQLNQSKAKKIKKIKGGRQSKKEPITRKKEDKKNIIDLRSTNQLLLNKLPEVELDYLEYSVLNREKMTKMSVVNVNTKTKGEQILSTPKDSRFGTLENNVLCGCCKKTNLDCSGHMGHIDLSLNSTTNFKIIHPFFRLNLIRVLQCVCFNCSSLLISEDELIQKNITSLEGINRIKQIVSLTANKKTCLNCKMSVKYIYKPQYSGDVSHIDMKVYEKGISDKSISKNLTVDKIEDILKKITPKTIKLLGFLSNTSPTDYLMDFVPVLPICTRPYTVRDDNEKDEYLTLAYEDILGKLNSLNGYTDRDDATKLKTEILYYYTHLCDNKDGSYKLSPQDICKSISDRITGKEGLLRGNLLGKRADFTGRTPIGPNRTLNFGDIAPPRAMSAILTIPEIITQYNYNFIQELVKQNRIDKYSKKDRYTVKYNFDPKKNQKLEIGDIVYRYSMDGDIILFNRQPTLHKQSMLGYFCRFQDKYSIGMHLSSTTGHNADFDGDEGNIHMLQTIESQVEGKLVMCAKNCIMSANSSSPIASLIFNSLSGAYLLSTTDKIDSDKGTAIDDIFEGKVFKEGLSKVIFNINSSREFKTRCKDCEDTLNIKLTAGQLLCSSLFPKTFWYNKSGVKIVKGILISGTLKKSVLGNSHGSIIQSLFKFYGKTVTSNFISDANFLFNWYLEIYGLTISVLNCDPVQITDEIGEDFNDFKEGQIKQLNLEVENLYKNETKNTEDDIISLIEEKKGRLDKKIESSLKPDNPLVIMAKSGAKGKTADTGKLVGLLGQQFVNNKRPEKLITNNQRWLTTFSVDDKSIESRGFTKNSFYQGLNPDEFFAHAQASRIGLTDTAVKTSEIGAMQRKMVKAQEDLIVNYDGSVRNQNGIIYQLFFGVGFNCEYMIKSNDNDGNTQLSFIDMREAVGKTNQKYGYLDDLESTIKTIIGDYEEEIVEDLDESGIENVGEGIIEEEFDQE